MQLSKPFSFRSDADHALRFSLTPKNIDFVVGMPVLEIGKSDGTTPTDF